MKRRTIAAALVLVMSTVTGCAGLSAAGPVGESMSEERADPLSKPYTRVIAAPPRRNVSDQAIVQGFIAAMADFSYDHAVAKQYLTPEAREDWDPQASGAVVYESRTDRVTTKRDEQDPADSPRRSEGTLNVKIDPIAEILSDGRYSAKSAQDEFRFQLKKIKGQWRIDGLDPKLLLRSSDLARTYRKVDLHFLGRDGLRLVPDPVYLPVTGTDLPTAMVRRLGNGPTESLEKAVKPALFDESSVEDVLIEGNRLTVALGGSARTRLRTGTATTALVAQLVYTLAPLPGVDHVGVRIGGRNVTISGKQWFHQDDAAMTAFSPAGLPENTEGYIIRDGRLHRVEPRTVRIAPYVGPAGDGQVRLREPAVSHDTEKAAGLTGPGSVTVVGASEESAPRVWLRGEDLTAPSWGPDDRLWVADRSKAGTTGAASRVYRTDGKDQEEVELPPDLASSEITKLRVSRDGSRLLVVAETDGRSDVYVAAITADGVAEEQQVAVVRPDQEVLDAAWLDGTHVVLLTKGQDEGGLELTKAAIAGPEAERVTEGGVPEHVQSVAAAPGEDRVLLGAKGNRIWRKKDDAWESIEGGGSDPAFPG